MDALLYIQICINFMICNLGD